MNKPQLRNLFESELMLGTLSKVITAALAGTPVSFQFSDSGRRHLRLISLVMHVISVEAWINGLTEQFGIAVPRSVPSRLNPGKTTAITLEGKIRFLLGEAKKNLKMFELRRIERSGVLKEVNAATATICRAIQLRNQLAHGKAFFALTGSARKKHHLSHRLRNLDNDALRHVARACRVYKQFCQLMINPDYIELHNGTGQQFLMQATGVKIAPPLVLRRQFESWRKAHGIPHAATSPGA